MRTRLTLIIVLGIAMPATAVESAFDSPQGFSITPPQGWEVASKDTVGQLSQAVRQHFDKLGNIDLDKLAVVVFNPDDSHGSQNLNVVVYPGNTPVEEAGAADKLVSELRDHYKEMGVALGKVSGARRTFGPHEALVADVESNIGGLSLRQWQVMMPAGGRTLIITCTAPQETSNSSGAYEIYVRAFPDNGGLSKISNNGGLDPIWSHSGHDLLYQEGEREMAVSYSITGGNFAPDKPRVWLAKVGGTAFGLTPDGKRLAVLAQPDPADAPKPAHEVVLLLNFFDELRRRVQETK